METALAPSLDLRACRHDLDAYERAGREELRDPGLGVFALRRVARKLDAPRDLAIGGRADRDTPGEELVSEGLAATGFGEFLPLDEGTDRRCDCAKRQIERRLTDR
ncbi:MAG TPA: hypothetical protein VKA21_11590 [Candidatus Binatia bacterium]|nr:hypothetical protein [Candidatus Binatia bacterium]